MTRENRQTGIRQWALPVLFLFAAAAGCGETSSFDRLRDRLASREAKTRSAAAMRLGQYGSRAVSPLCKALDDPDRRVVGSAIMSLTEIGSPAKPAVARLILLAFSQDEGLRFGALEALVSVAPDDPRVSSILFWSLLSADDDIRITGATGLGRMGSCTPLVTESLLAAARDPCYQVRVEALFSLGEQGCAHELVVPVLARSLGDGHWEVRKAALVALGKFGSRARDGLYAVLEAFRREKEDLFRRMRSTAAIALGRIGALDPEVIPSLIEGLSDPEPTFQQGCMRALGSIGPASAEAVPALVEFLTSSEAALRAVSAETLWRILKGTKNKDVLAALRAALAKETIIPVAEAFEKAIRQINRTDY